MGGFLLNWSNNPAAKGLAAFWWRKLLEKIICFELVGALEAEVSYEYDLIWLRYI